MATFKEITNRVLQVLGEDEIPSGASEITDDYHKLIATFVNQIKEEVEDAHQWRALIRPIASTIAAGTNLDVLTGTNDRTRVYRTPDYRRGQYVAEVYEITNPDSPVRLRERSAGELAEFTIGTDPSTAGPLEAFSLRRFASLGIDEVTLVVTPLPSDVFRTVEGIYVVPQDRIGFDAPDTNVYVPARPIELGALWYALEERGEELGVNSVYSERKYRQALDDAIALDSNEQGENIQLVPV